MITDDEVMLVLERANPATVDDAIPMLGAAGYLDFLRRAVTVVDHEPARSEPSSARRWPILIAAAAAVVAIALVATRNDVTPADQPTPTVTVPPTTPPRALVDPPGERFVPGTYFVDEVEGTPTARIFVTIDAGWRDFLAGDATALGMVGPDAVSGDPTDLGVLDFSRPGAVFSDACHWEDGYHRGPLTTVDGLVAALTEQQGWADVTDPTDISVDGYAGKAFQRTAPADTSDCDTLSYGPRWVSPEDRGKLLPAFRSWQREEGDLTPDTGGNLAGSFYEQGEIETLWILDIDGTVVVINTRQFPEASGAAHAEFAAVLDSIRIDRA